MKSIQDEQQRVRSSFTTGLLKTAVVAETTYAFAHTSMQVHEYNITAPLLGQGEDNSMDAFRVRMRDHNPLSCSCSGCCMMMLASSGEGKPTQVVGRDFAMADHIASELIGLARGCQHRGVGCTQLLL